MLITQYGAAVKKPSITFRLPWLKPRLAGLIRSSRSRSGRACRLWAARCCEWDSPPGREATRCAEQTPARCPLGARGGPIISPPAASDSPPDHYARNVGTPPVPISHLRVTTARRVSGFTTNHIGNKLVATRFTSVWKIGISSASVLYTLNRLVCRESQRWKVRERAKKKKQRPPVSLRTNADTIW